MIFFNRLGCAAFLTVQVLATPGIDLEYVANGLHWFFLLVPHYSLSTGIRDTYTSYATTKMCKYFVDTCVANRQLTPDECWDIACYNLGNSTQALKDYCCSKLSKIIL